MMATVDRFYHNGLMIGIGIDHKGLYTIYIETGYSELVYSAGGYPSLSEAHEAAVDYCNEWGAYHRELDQRNYGGE